jgi:acyl carrier protein
MASREKLMEILIDAIRAVTNKDSIPINENEKFEEYGLDSLDRMNLLLELEERLGLDLGELDLSKTNTFHLLHENIKHLLKD